MVRMHVPPGLAKGPLRAMWKWQRSGWCLGSALGLLLGSWVSAQVPQFINFQGRVAVSGVPFSGTGQFKFALVDGGSGQTTTYWSNNGTSVGGSEPTASISIPVDKGLYAVLLGDTTLANMTALPISALDHPEVRLRVWFNDGVHGFQQLPPDQRLAAVGYALMAQSAQSVTDGVITAAKLAPGAVGDAQLAPGAALANLQASGLSGVPSGGIVLSTNESPALLGAGYVKIGATQLAESWQHLTNGVPPAPRNYHTAIWTGNEMIVWGGNSISGITNDGGIYLPALNRWLSMPKTPTARVSHTAIWTGSEMIVWGGYFNNNVLSDGGRFNPSANSWTVLSSTLANTPTARADHTAVWTGSEMIVWGGTNHTGRLNDGGRFHPTANSWTALPSTLANTPAARAIHTAVWTGNEMIVWGGYGNSGLLNDGGRFNPAANTWNTTATAGAPAARSYHTAVWTGSEMMIWGGNIPVSPYYLNDGGRYDPMANSWMALPSTLSSTPIARAYHTAVWTGTEMMIWGGYGNNTALSDGGLYNPTANSWTPLPSIMANTPAGRYLHTAVWTGNEMVVWGGCNQSGFLNDGGRYNAAAISWQPLPHTSTCSPAGRYLHTAVWTGSEMIVWGGSGTGISLLNDGGRYNPAANSWTLISANLAGTPVARNFHTAVWTGTEMIVWGGKDSTYAPLNNGGRYNPAVNSWTTLSPTLPSTPAPRYAHTAVWTGSEMIIWGGYGSTDSLGDGGRYQPAANSWVAIPSTLANTPTARSYHTAVWTGNEMIVWGGTGWGPSGALIMFDHGGRYNPVANSWTVIPNTLSTTPAGRKFHSAIWTGNEMIVWGGYGHSGALNDGGCYYPSTNGWVAVTSPLASRYLHTAVWTGTEMIVFGGGGNSSFPGYFNGGGRYNPVANSWAILPIAPAGRDRHTAIWTGSEMIVWGGWCNTGCTNDNWSYSPGNKVYLYLKP